MCNRAIAIGWALAAGGCTTQFVDPMEKQKKYLPYQANSLFPDGRAMRPLVEGTVPRERKRLDPILRDGMLGDVPVARVPIPITADLLALGRARYDIVCAPCHGLLGDGDSVVATKMALRPPPSIIKDSIAAQPRGQVYRTITAGYGLMPSYAGQMTVEERWAAVAYLQALRLSQSAPLDAAPPEVRQRLRQGSP